MRMRKPVLNKLDGSIYQSYVSPPRAGRRSDGNGREGNGATDQNIIDVGFPWRRYADDACRPYDHGEPPTRALHKFRRQLI